MKNIFAHIFYAKHNEQINIVTIFKDKENRTEHTYNARFLDLLFIFAMSHEIW